MPHKPFSLHKRPTTRKNKHIYYVQYYGVRSGGEEYLECNFFVGLPPNDCPLVDGNPPSEWRERLLSTRGGGHQYWIATFDLKSRSLRSFGVNAPW